MPFAGRPPEKIVAAAIAAIGRIARIEAASVLHHFPAWPDPADPPFVNAAAAISAGLGPEPLLAALQGIEAGFGRRRSRRNEPRTLDLDLLDYRGLIRQPADPEGLALPHSRLAEREFVLAPLVEIAPDWRHPATGATARDLLSCLREGRPPPRRPELLRCNS